MIPKSDNELNDKKRRQKMWKLLQSAQPQEIYDQLSQDKLERVIPKLPFEN